MITKLFCDVCGKQVGELHNPIQFAWGIGYIRCMTCEKKLEETLR